MSSKHTLSLVTAALVTVTASHALATNFVVTTAADAAFPPVNSLRWAINQANANPGPDTISFAIPGPGPFVVNVVAPGLPAITSPVVIDGLSQPGASCPAGAWAPALRIELNGGGIPANGLAFNAGSDGSVLRGVAVRGFAGNGVVLASNGDALDCNFVGTDVGGVADLGNTGSGVYITGSAEVIGGGSFAQRNVIIGNDTDGIRVVPAAAVNQLNLIQNNYIGVGATGGATGNSGIGVNVLNGTGTMISANWIENNGALGIDLNGDGATGNDLGDGDVGPNNRQNYPTTTAIAAGQVAAMMDSVAASAYRVEFFQSATCGGDGGAFLGSMYVTPGGFVSPVLPLVAGRYLTMTATRLVFGAARDTSEASPCFLVP